MLPAEGENIPVQAMTKKMVLLDPDPERFPSMSMRGYRAVKKVEEEAAFHAGVEKCGLPIKF